MRSTDLEHTSPNRRSRRFPPAKRRPRGSLGRWSHVVVSGVLVLPAGLAAQAGPTGFQEYLVLGYEQHVWDMMSKVEAGEGGGPFADGMNSLITATANADNQVITYDHYEDGFEADISSPVQASTIVLGDGNPANGDACDFNNDPCGVDVLLRGDFVNLGSDQGLAAGCTVPSVSPLVFTELCSSVPLNPRCAVQGACTASEVRFDGGDLIVTSGGNLSLIHSQDPLTQFIGGSTEILSRQAVENAFSYSVPVGEDLYPAFGCPPDCVMEPFHYVDLNLVAFEDSTTVLVDSPGAGTVTFTLNRGEHWSSLGFIDDGAFDPLLFLTINSGAKVSTTAPIAGLIFTGGDGQWATRHYTLLPDILHSTDYITTAPGDDPAAGPSVADRPANLYIFNPDPLNPTSVTVTDTVGTAVVPIAPNSVVDYFTATGRFVPNGSTVRLTSNRNFWGISAYDHVTNISDWGHSWLATKFLTTSYTVSFAPGTLDPPVDMVNLNGIYIAATQDNTQVQIDFDNDGTFDVADLDGDGVPDPAPLPGNTYLVNSLGALLVFDPNDFDNTGTRIVANRPVAVAYGQETDLTGFGDTALDTGFTVYPPLFLDTVLLLEKTVDTPVLSTAGGVVTYTLSLSTGEFGPIANLQVFDLLPPGIVGADYVPGSTVITYPDLSTDFADPVASIDPTTGRDRLDWALSPDSLGANQTLTVVYSIDIPPAPGGMPRLLTNEAHGEGTLGGSRFSPFDTAQLTQSEIAIDKTVDDLSPEAGDVLTYTLNVFNNGVAAETNAIVTDAIPPNTTFVPGSITSAGPFAGSGTFDSAQNAVAWTAASFPAGGPHALTFQVQVNPGVPSGTVIANQGGYESAQTPFFLSNEVESTVVGPDLLVSKRGPGVLHPNEVGTFEIFVQNVGDATADNVLVRDPLPLTNAAYVSESMQWRRNVTPFVSVTDAADADEGTELADRLELLVAALGPGEDLTFRFQIQVDPGSSGLFVNNQANVSASDVLPQDTNLVQVPIVGDAEITGHVFLDADGDGVQGPGEPDLANVDVVVTDKTGTVQIVSTDANGDYAATVQQACYEDSLPVVAYGGSTGLLDWSAPGDAWTEFSDQGDADQDPATAALQVAADPLGVFGNALRIGGGPGATPSKGFTRQADLSAGAGFTQGFATLTLDFQRQTFGAGDVVTLDVDYDNDGTFNDVLGTFNFPGGGSDGAWQSTSFVLDAAQLPDSPVVFRWVTTAGFSAAPPNLYLDNLRLCNTEATVNVDEADADFPPGAILSTANDPQSLQTVNGGSVAATPVGYEPPALAFTKASDAPFGEVLPGQTVTYSMTVTNQTTVTQTGIDLADPLPAGTSAVPGSTVVTVNNPALRVTEYFLASGTFAGTVFDLTLNQPLSADYFVVVQGSDGDGTAAGGRGPDENYAALTQDPFGTGGLGTSAGASTLRLERGNAVNSWVGVVTVVECLADCAVNGFALLDVRRVVHTGAATAGAATSAVGWADINQVFLIGGYNGAGCTTAQAATPNTKVCHARLFPSGADQINWTRDAGGAVLTTATSTVMVVSWGSAWTVQRVRVQGSNGGDGANAVAEYNTAAISPVARANTWVWGTGHTNDEGIGDAGEAVLLTLGDGVNQNAIESLVAAGNEFAGNALDFEVYALTHADLAADYAFKADGDTAAVTVDVGVANAIGNRMALVYNGQNGNGNAYPRPMFSARYLDDTTVRLERRRSGQPFPAWVQGIDLSSVSQATVSAGNDPPGLIVPADGFTLAPGGSLTVTFQVVVDDPLAAAITQITNAATLNTDQQGPFNASVTDTVIRLGVTVEPNNAGFAVPGGTVTYTHLVTNTGQEADSYDLTLLSELGYTVELIDPMTQTVIATDSNGDGVWDGGITVNTGTLNPGESEEFRVRVRVPGGAALGTEETTTLTATSNRDPAGTGAFATDETTVVESLDVGPVTLVPDHSGVVSPGGTIVYTHALTNNTGATDRFDLSAFPSLPGWTATIFDDSNGDGVFTPGIDVAISQSRLLSDGQLQTLFVVVDAPAGATQGDTDVVSLTAISQNDPALFDAGTDTTTVVPASTHDLSGGGTLLVDPGDTPVFPGTLKNLRSVNDRFDFTITASPFFGLDGLNHPTQLFIDTNGDGVPDTQIAEDTDGDGSWDTIAPGFDTNGDSNPDVAVAGNGELAYELRRPVDPVQPSYRDPVTLTTTSQATGEVDSVTATNLLAAATHALLSSFGLSTDGRGVVVEWQTVLEHETIGFVLARGEEGQLLRPLHAGALASLPRAPLGGGYRFHDETARAGEAYTYLLSEVDAQGRQRILGWRNITVSSDPAVSIGEPAAHVYELERRVASGLRTVETAVAEKAARTRAARTRAARTQDTPHATVPPAQVKVRFERTGLYHITASQLATVAGVGVPEVTAWVAAGELRLYQGDLPAPRPCPSPPGGTVIFSDGFESESLCAWGGVVPGYAGATIPWLPAAGNEGLFFHGVAVDSIYSEGTVYWLELGRQGLQMAETDGGLPTPAPGQHFAERVHHEEDLFPATTAVSDPEGDFWFWLAFLPQFGAGTQEAMLPAPGLVAGTGATLRLWLQGNSDTPSVAPDHQLTVEVNGHPVGEVLFDGRSPATFETPLEAGLLVAGGNTLTLTSSLLPGVTVEESYLDAFELRYTRRYEAVADQLVASANGNPVLTLDGFSRGDVEVFDISAPLAPRRLTGVRGEELGGSFRFSFRPAAGAARYLALPLALAASPSLAADQPSNLLAEGNRGEYVVVAATGLEASAQALAEARSGRWETRMVRLEDVYDEFNRGQASPDAIRDFLRHARDRWQLAPRWVVLAGDSSFDYRDILGFGGNLLPSPMVSTPEGLFASDVRLADLAGRDGVPEVAVGRIPARTDAELATYVDKLLSYEAALGGSDPWRQRSTWVADDVDEGGEFVLDSESLIDRFPAGLSVERIYLDDLGAPAARSELLSRLNAGSLIVNYLGHGGLDRLATEGILLTQDVAGLTNGARQPFVIAATCAVNRFDVPNLETLGESWVRHGVGGAIALWSPTGFSFNRDGVLLGNGLAGAVFRPRTTIGEAINQALADYVASAPEPLAHIPFVYVLLGDPAIELRP